MSPASACLHSPTQFSIGTLSFFFPFLVPVTIHASHTWAPVPTSDSIHNAGWWLGGEEKWGADYLFWVEICLFTGHMLRHGIGRHLFRYGSLYDRLQLVLGVTAELARMAVV